MTLPVMPNGSLPLSIFGEGMAGDFLFLSTAESVTLCKLLLTAGNRQTNGLALFISCW
jgi:hypothetical protein